MKECGEGGRQIEAVETHLVHCSIGKEKKIMKNIKIFFNLNSYIILFTKFDKP